MKSRTMIAGVAALALASSAVASLLPDSPKENPNWTVTLGEQPRRVPAKSIARSASAPVGEVYMVSPIWSGAQSHYDAFWGRIDLKSGKITQLNKGIVYSNQEDYDSQAGCVRQGVLYIPQFLQDMITGEVQVIWKRVEVATGKQLEPIDFGSDTFAYLTHMTYDEKEDVFYGISINFANGSMGNLVSFDCKQPTWSPKQIAYVGGTDGDFMASICYNPADGELYGIKDNGCLYIIDKKTGSLTLVKEFDVDQEAFVVGSYPWMTPMAYSPKDHSFVLVNRDNEAQQMTLAYIDVSNDFEAVEGAYLSPVAFCSTLWCADPYAPDGAPELPTISEISFPKGSLTGSVTVTAPERTFDGRKITAPMEMLLTDGDTPVWTATMTAGQKENVTLSLPQGMHELSLIASLGGDNVSAPAMEKFYVGIDTPLAPANLRLDGYTLSWDAVPETGVNGGYVDPAKVVYQVFDNTEPLSIVMTGREFPIEKGDLKRYELNVRAGIADTELASERSEFLSKVLGNALELPVEFEPTREQSLLFDNLNANRDEFAWKFLAGGVPYREDPPCMSVGSGLKEEWPDDWLFLPITNFPDEESQYDLSFFYRNYYMNDRDRNDMEVYIGTEATPAAMTRKLYGHVDEHTSEYRELNLQFTVPAPGDYVVGIHAGATPNENGYVHNYRGLCVRNIHLNTSEASTAAPGPFGDLLFSAAPEGALVACADFTAPTNALSGQPLDPTEKMDVTFSCGDEKTVVQALPGEKLHMEVAVPADGKHQVKLRARNSSDAGVASMETIYVGTDKPLPPRNVSWVPDADNLGMTISWEAPETGVNGGWIDPENLSYIIYTSPGTATYIKLAETKELSYNFRIEPGKPASYHVGPCATNRVGSSVSGDFAFEVLGTPREIPMLELFGSAGFNYSEWKNTTASVFSSCVWNSVSNLNGTGVGDPVFNTGGLQCVNLGSGSGFGQLEGPKFSTLMVPSARLSVRYWDYDKAAKMEIYGRCHGANELVKIAELQPSRQGSEWKEWKVQLPKEMLDKPWVQLNMRTVHDAGQSAILDSWTVEQTVDTDWKLSSVSAPVNCSVGFPVNIDVEAVNAGLDPSSAQLTVTLLGNGEQLASQSFNINRTPAAGVFQRTVSFDLLAEWMELTAIDVVARVETADDEIEQNNERTASFALMPPTVPTVGDLSMDQSSGAPVLSWSQPVDRAAGFESFENIPSFLVTDRIASWNNVDQDGMVQFGIMNAAWDGYDQPSAWTVFNAPEMGTVGAERLSAHSGDQMLIARSIEYEEGVDEPTQNHDWLISPEIVGGTKLSFWMNTITETYPETVSVYVSATDRQPESFVKAQPFTKSGVEFWEHISYRLPAEAKYFALVYESWGAFAAMIDDLSFTPASADYNGWKVTGYDVYRIVDGEAKLAKSNVKETTWTETQSVDGNVGYYVVARADRGEGNCWAPKSNVVWTAGSGVGTLGATDARTRWFNLQGVEIPEPEGQGVFLKVQGGTVVKVIR